MSRPPEGHRPLRVVEFAAGASPAPPAPDDLASRASELGADRILLDVWSTADGWAVLHTGPTVERRDGSLAPIADLALRGSDGLATLHTLEAGLLAAHRHGLGLHLRIHESRVIGTLAAALGVSGGEGHTALRRRFLVVVPSAKIGRRLRAEAPDLPSAVELPAAGAGWRGGLGRRFPNLARAAADADDLVLPHAVAGTRERLAALARRLGRRGAYLWVCGLSAVEAADLLADPALAALGGCVARTTA